MTLIAHFNAFGTPTLLGDLLVSSNEKPTSEIHIPASRNINERIFLRQNYFIRGLVQKIVLVNDRVAIAWAGNYERAANLFSSIEPLRMVSEIDAAYVGAFFDGLDLSSGDRPLSLIALVVNESKADLIWRNVTPPRDYGEVTHVIFSGSGSRQFEAIFPQLCQNIVHANSTASMDDLREGFDATVVSSLAGEEFLAPIPLQAGWGGGFELIRAVGGRLLRRGRQLYLNFVAEPDRARIHWRVWFVPIIRYTDYLGERTILQAIEHEVAPNGKILPGRRDVFIVSAPGSSPPDLQSIEAMGAPNLEAHDLVQAFIDLRGSDRSLTYVRRDVLPALRYHAPPGSDLVDIDLEPNFVSAVLEGVRRDVQRDVTFAGFRNRPE